MISTLKRRVIVPLTCFLAWLPGLATAVEKATDNLDHMMNELTSGIIPKLENSINIKSRRACAYGNKYIIFRLFVVNRYGREYDVSKYNEASCPQGVMESNIRRMNVVDYFIFGEDALPLIGKALREQRERHQDNPDCRVKVLIDDGDSISVAVFDLSATNTLMLSGCYWGR